MIGSEKTRRKDIKEVDKKIKLRRRYGWWFCHSGCREHIGIGLSPKTAYNNFVKVDYQ